MIIVTKKKKKKFRFLFFIPACLLVIITIMSFIGSYWIEIINKYHEKKELENQIVALKEEEEALKVDVSRLEDPDYVARFAREKYMYSKDNEIILRLPDNE